MNNNTKELDVDFIGGQEPLTKKEELLVSKAIKTLKKYQAKKLPKGRKSKQTT